MSTVGLFLLGTGLATLGASMARPIRELLVPTLRAKRAATRLVRTRVADAKPGELVKLVGRLERARDPLVAPISGRPCAHYVARVEAKSGKGWRTIAELASTETFDLADETGRATVDASRVLVEVVIDHLWDPRETDAETGFDLDGFLLQVGVQKPPSDSAVRLRYREGALEEGETVTVVGIARDGAGGEPRGAYRDAGRRLLVGAPSGGAVFVSDGLHYA
jgi:hypothetical protein